MADAPPAELPPTETTVANEPLPSAVEAIAAELPPPITAMNEPAPIMDAPAAPTESASMIENSGTNTAMADASPSYSKHAKSSFVGSGGGRGVAINNKTQKKTFMNMAEVQGL